MFSVTLASASITFTALVLGGMVFFAAIAAPTAFSKLPAEYAGQFIRGIFPRYYLYMLITTVAAGLSIVPGHLIDGLVMLAVAALFLWARQLLMPAINEARDKDLEGDAEAGSKFKRLHRLSVIVNMLQMLTVLAIFLRLIAPEAAP